MVVQLRYLWRQQLRLWLWLQYKLLMDEERATKPLVRTVDHLKTTTTSMRGFADSVDHLLNALEEFFPFIEKVASSTERLRNRMMAPRNLYRRPPGRR